jgi:hypothetical protein
VEGFVVSNGGKDFETVPLAFEFPHEPLHLLQVEGRESLKSSEGASILPHPFPVLVRSVSRVVLQRMGIHTPRPAKDPIQVDENPIHVKVGDHGRVSASQAKILSRISSGARSSAAISR